MADEGIRQLQDELREVYRSSAKQKLSERNVIEIVTKLIELRLVDVIYTTDGKTYLTHKQLEKEIQDEIIVHGGRISLSDLQQILSVDYNHIEVKATEMVQHDKNLTLIMGQLINDDYRLVLADDINDVLQEKGHVTIVELTQQHDLPADFIRKVITANLGKKIKGRVDPYEEDIFYTDAFVSRIKAQIRGALSAVTVPTAVGPIRKSIGCQEHLFHSVLDELITQGRLAGVLSGSREDKSQFLPRVYSRAQNEWVESFYKQNGYIEYNALTRLGISDAKDFIKKRYKEEKLVYLSSCCVGQATFSMVDSCVEDALSSGLWCDVSTVVPSILSSKDKLELLTMCIKKKPQVFICGDNVVASNDLISSSMDGFKDIIMEKAEKNATSQKSRPDKMSDSKASSGRAAPMDEGSGSTKEDKREQRRKKAAEAGASKKQGTGGREVKMKSTKKKGRGGRGGDVEDSDDDMGDVGGGAGKQQQEDRFMTLEEVEEALQNQAKLSDCPESLISMIASKIQRPLQKEYQEASQSIFLKLSGAKQKKMAVEVQDKVNGLWTNIRLFEKGQKIFDDQVQGHLVKHLLKTVGSDLVNTIVVALAEDNMVTVTETEEEMTPEWRRKIVLSFPKTTQDPLNKLIGSLNGESLEDFYSHVTTMCGPMHLGLLLKKADKKVDRQLVFAHRQQLADQLRNETEPAMTLHLTSVLLFQTFHQSMLHVPGRLVPSVLQNIASSIDQDKMAVLSNMQDLVVKHARYKSDPEVYSEDEVQSVADELSALVDQVKDIGLNTKRNAAAAAQE